MPIRSAKLRQTTDARHCFHSVRGVVVACLAGWLIAQPAAWAAPEPVSTKASAPVVAASAPVAPEEESSWWSRPKRLLSDVRSNANDMVLSAMSFLGVPYKRGGTSEASGFDCSGFTRHVFELSLGRLLPRRAAEQAASPDMMDVSHDELKPGDLVFFNTMRRAFSHVGIYIGEGKFIHSPRVGSSVRVEDMREAYWVQRYNGARRAPEMSTAKSEQLIKALSGSAEAEKPGAAENRQ